MNKWNKLLIAGLAMAALSGTAAARDNISFSITFGTPAPIYAPPPAYVYAPAPVYYPAPVVVHRPPRVVYYSTPYYSTPYYSAPPGHVKHWNKRHGRHRDWR